MADEQSEPNSPAVPAEEFVEEEVFVIVAEKMILEMLRAASSGGDPDLLYAEFWANSGVQQVVEMGPTCECCECDEEDDDCECECTCEDEEME